MGKHHGACRTSSLCFYQLSFPKPGRGGDYDCVYGDTFGPLSAIVEAAVTLASQASHVVPYLNFDEWWCPLLKQRHMLQSREFCSIWMVVLKVAVVMNFHSRWHHLRNKSLQCRTSILWQAEEGRWPSHVGRKRQWINRCLTSKFKITSNWKGKKFRISLCSTRMFMQKVPNATGSFPSWLQHDLV